MSINPSYRFSLVEADDRLSLLAELGDRKGSFSYEPEFNKAGSASVVLPLESSAVPHVAKLSTAVVVERNGRPAWSGYVVKRKRSAEASELSIDFVGWLEEWEHRYVRPSEEAQLTFTAKTSGEIIQTLCTVVNAQTDTDGVVRPTHIAFGSASDTQTRTVSYKRGQSYASIVRSLVETENGCDIYIDPITVRISVRPPDAFRDLDDVLFAYGEDPNNLSNVVEDDDGLSLFNRYTGVTQGGVIIPADDGAYIDRVGSMREKWINVATNDALIAGAYINAELVYSRYGDVTYQITPNRYGDMYRPFDDFSLGDQAYLSVEKENFRIDRQPVRLFSFKIEIDENGNEILGDLGTRAA